MIEITDKPTNTPPCWEVVDTAGVLPTTQISYNPNGIIGYDRVRALQQIVDYYAMNGRTQTAWKIHGIVFTIQ